MGEFVRIAARDAEIVADVDVCVAGGGPAGLGAALAAARLGARVCLLERHGFLGGNFTAASVGSVCGLYVGDGSGGFDYVTRGLAEEVAESLKAAGRAMGPIPFQGSAVLLYVPWAAKRLFDHLVTTEPNVTLFLHALVSDVVSAGGRVEAVVVATKRGPVAVRAKAFVDATGDGDVVAFAGGRWMLGEPGFRQHASMQFLMEHADDAVALGEGLAALKPAIEAHGSRLSRDGGALIPTFRPGEFVGAMTRVRAPDGGPLDATRLDHATWGELEGRRLAEEAASFVIEHVPGFAGAFLADTAPNLGVRETRRVVGDYVLTGEDVAGCARFPDAVAAGAWPREYHVAGRSTEYVHLPEGGWYQVPLRSLRPVGLDNVWVAGRCVSADHDALASLRVMAPSMALGQAAGTAAVLESRGELDVAAVQASLREQGAFLGGEQQ
ncbi:MAG TPA: FAD-dependent oxidoreductase [Acidimicrobiales bacterium]|nr:FAD-dependent oxidoreductase [Acidimicrobiales bacterium]